MPLPNWIRPFDILAPIHAGAGLGLQMRSQADQEAAQLAQEQHAADALRLNWAQLSQQAANEQAIREQQSNAAQALTLHRAALERHQLAQEQQAGNRDASLERHRNALEAHQLAMEQNAQDKLNAPLPTPPSNVTAIPVLNPDGSPNTELIAAPSASGKGVVLHPLHPTKEGALNDTQKSQLRQLDIAEREARHWSFEGDRNAALQQIADDRKAVYGTRASAPRQSGTPKIGEVRKGYRFLGGDPSQKDSWEKVK